jgi:hypothetical protein
VHGDYELPSPEVLVAKKHIQPKITRISLVNSIELHAPTNSTQKLKLIGKGGQFTYTPTNRITKPLMSHK